MITLPASGLAPTVLRRLEKLVGKAHVSTDDADRLTYARDAWPLHFLWEQQGRVPHPPDCVCWPATTDQVAAVVRLANEEGFAVVPYGGGSGVCGAAVPVRGGVTLDLKRLDRLIELDETSLLCVVQPGMVGQHLEEALAARGYTLGHFPSSIYCSTVGGWLATRSAGQLSTRYGKIEDMVRGLEVVLPTGEVGRVRASPRRATGPDLLQLFIGSEGTLGVITEATLVCHPTPAARAFRAFTFPSFDHGREAIRRILRLAVRPAAVRLYDAIDTMLVAREGSGKKGGALQGVLHRAKGWLLRNPLAVNLLTKLAPDRCLLVLVFEGAGPLIQAEEAIAVALCEEEGGKDEGQGPARTWWDHRYDVSYKGSPVFCDGGFVDTFEVAAPWEAVPALEEAIRAAISPHAVCMVHLSHAYMDGASLYFSFAAAGKDPEDAEVRYRRIWDAALAACLEAGGATSHHHGIGLLKGACLREEMGELFEVLRHVKEALDPNDILNPGKLGLDPKGF